MPLLARCIRTQLTRRETQTFQRGACEIDSPLAGVSVHPGDMKSVACERQRGTVVRTAIEAPVIGADGHSRLEAGGLAAACNPDVAVAVLGIAKGYKGAAVIATSKR